MVIAIAIAHTHTHTHTHCTQKPIVSKDTRDSDSEGDDDGGGERGTLVTLHMIQQWVNKITKVTSSGVHSEAMPPQTHRHRHTNPFFLSLGVCVCHCHVQQSAVALSMRGCDYVQPKHLALPGFTTYL